MFYRKTLFFLTGILLVSFLVSCGGGSAEVRNGTLESTTITVNPTRGVGFSQTGKHANLDSERGLRIEVNLRWTGAPFRDHFGTVFTPKSPRRA